MNNKNLLLKGTLILTLSGFLSKIIGFIYRIFLSQIIGAQGMGIYQLIFPLLTLCYAFAVGGIQTAISRFVAAKIATKDHQGSRDIFLISTGLSVLAAILVSYLLYKYSYWFAIHILMEESCIQLLKIMAFSIPMGAFHSCVSGYYIARKKLLIPATAQLLEQLTRVLISYLLFLILQEKNMPTTPALAVIGMLAGELASMLFSFLLIFWEFHKYNYKLRYISKPIKTVQTILCFSFPLTCNRLLVNLLHSIESILIPGHLRLYGLDHASSLSIYGILTGMALPLILFPCAITNALSTVLLPSIAEDQATGNKKNIRKSILLSCKYCILLGFLSTLFFFYFGDLLGILLFKNEFAGTFIKTLSFICPCLYLSSTLNGILNGLGKTNQILFLNMLGLSTRLGFVFFVIPKYGIVGYLWGLIISELIVTIFSLYHLRPYLCSVI